MMSKKQKKQNPLILWKYSLFAWKNKTHKKELYSNQPPQTRPPKKQIYKRYSSYW